MAIAAGNTFMLKPSERKGTAGLFPEPDAHEKLQGVHGNKESAPPDAGWRVRHAALA